MLTLRKFLVATLLVLNFQTSEGQDQSKIVTFDLKELPKTSTVKLSDLGFVDIKYIPLETNENCLIRASIKILVGTDCFLTHRYNLIYKFKSDGSFVTKVGTEGRGPNEFTVVHAIDVDKDNENIYLVSGWQKKFYVYSGSGRFIRTFKCPLNTTNFKITKEGILCYNSNSFGNVETSFNLIDTTGRLIKNFPNRYPWSLSKKNTYVFQNENLFYWFGGQLYKKEVYSDTVYVFENMIFKPHLVIEHGKRLLTAKARSNSTTDEIMENFIEPVNMFEFGNFIYYEFIIGRNGFGLVGSKKNNFKAIVDPEKTLINDLDGDLYFWPKAILDDNTIVGCIDAIKLKRYVGSDAFKNSIPKYPEKKKELEKLANNLKETDNPVLVLAKLKK